MFITSAELRKRTRTIRDEIAEKSGGKLQYEEFVACPSHGQIVLRFSLADAFFDVNDVDRYERMMRDCAGEAFLVDFMGEVYRRCGVDYSRMEQILTLCAERYGKTAIAPSPYAALLQEDAKALLTLCALPADCPVWEIQLEKSILLLLMGEDQKEIGSFHQGKTEIHVSSVNAVLCDGLMRAAFHAKHRGVSLARVFLETQ